MSEKLEFFAHTDGIGKEYKSAYFKSLEEAIKWVEGNGGGKVKQRTKEPIRELGKRVDKIIFDTPLRVFEDVYQSKID